jgi:hypothetical protein
MATTYENTPAHAASALQGLSSSANSVLPSDTEMSRVNGNGRFVPLAPRDRTNTLLDVSPAPVLSSPDFQIPPLPTIIDAAGEAASAVAPFAGPVGTALRAANSIFGGAMSMLVSTISTNGVYLGGAADPAAHAVLQGAMNTETNIKGANPNYGYFQYYDDSEIADTPTSLAKVVNAPAWATFSPEKWFASWRVLASGSIAGNVNNAVHNKDLMMSDIIKAYQENDTTHIVQGLFDAPAMMSLFLALNSTRFHVEIMVEAPTTAFDSVPIALSIVPPFALKPTDDPTPLQKHLVPNTIQQMRETSRFTFRLPWYLVNEYIDLTANANFGRLLLWNFMAPDAKDAMPTYTIFVRIVDIVTGRFNLPNEDVQSDDNPSPDNAKPEVQDLMMKGLPAHALEETDPQTFVSLYASCHRHFTSERPIKYRDLMDGNRLFSTIQHSGLQKNVPLFAIPVSPSACASRDNAGDNSKPLSVSPAWLISQFFAYWSGGLTFTVHSVATAQCAGRILLAHWPLQSAPTALQLRSVYNQLLELGFGRTAMIVCNQKGIYKIRRTARASSYEEAGLPVSNPQLFTDGFGAPSTQLSHGWLVIMPLTEISFNNTPGAGVWEYALSVKMNRDMRFYAPIGFPSDLQVQSDSAPEEDQEQSVYPTFDLAPEADPMKTIVHSPIIDDADVTNGGFYSTSRRLADFPGYPIIKHGMMCRGGTRVRVVITGPPLIVGKLIVTVKSNAAFGNTIALAPVEGAAITLGQTSSIRERVIIDVSKQRDFTFRCGYDFSDPLVLVDDNPYMCNFDLNGRNIQNPTTSNGKLHAKIYISLDEDFNIFNFRSVSILQPSVSRSLAMPTKTKAKLSVQSDDNVVEDRTPPTVPVVAIVRGKPHFRGESSITTTKLLPKIKSKPFRVGNLWNQYLERHYANNMHHPENPGFKHNHNMHLICCLDVLSSITRSSSCMNDAWTLTRKVMSGPKFDDVCNNCRAKFDQLFLAFTSTDGLKRAADSILPFARANQWRNPEYIQHCWETQFSGSITQALANVLSVYTDEQKRQFIHDFVPLRRCFHEICAHIDNIETLTAKLLKLPRLEDHDYDKLEPDTTIVYFLKWGLNLEALPDPTFAAPPECRSSEVLSFEKATMRPIKNKWGPDCEPILHTQGPPDDPVADPDGSKTTTQGPFLSRGVSQWKVVQQAKDAYTKARETADTVKDAASSVGKLADDTTSVVQSIVKWFKDQFDSFTKGFPLLASDPANMLAKFTELVCCMTAVYKSDSNLGRAASILQLLTSFGVTLKLASHIVELVELALQAAQDRKPAKSYVLTEETETTDIDKLNENLKENDPNTESTQGFAGDFLRTLNAHHTAGRGEMLLLGIPFAIFSAALAILYKTRATPGHFFSFIKTSGSISKDLLAMMSMTVLTVETVIVFVSLIKAVYDWWNSTRFPEAKEAHEHYELCKEIFAWNAQLQELLKVTPEQIIIQSDHLKVMRDLHARGHQFKNVVTNLASKKNLSMALVNYVNQAVRVLDELAAGANNAAIASQSRTCPVAYRFIGKPGLGKTSIIPAVAMRVAAANGDGRATREGSIYSWSIHARFQEGYYGQPSILIEEADADRTKNTAALSLLHLISSQPFLVSKASIEEKNTWMTSKYVWLSGNDSAQIPNIADTDAYFRRFRDIKVTAQGESKPDFSHLRFSTGALVRGARGNPPKANMVYEELIDWLTSDAKCHFMRESIVNKFTAEQHLHSVKGTRGALPTATAAPEPQPSTSTATDPPRPPPPPFARRIPNPLPETKENVRIFERSKEWDYGDKEEDLFFSGPDEGIEGKDDPSPDAASTSYPCGFYQDEVKIMSTSLPERPIEPEVGVTTDINLIDVAEVISGEKLTIEEERARTAEILRRNRDKGVDYNADHDGMTLTEMAAMYSHPYAFVDDDRLIGQLSPEMAWSVLKIQGFLSFPASPSAIFGLAQFAATNLEENFFLKVRNTNLLINDKAKVKNYLSRCTAGGYITSLKDLKPLERENMVEKLAEFELILDSFQLDTACIDCERCSHVTGMQHYIYRRLVELHALTQQPHVPDIKIDLERYKRAVGAKAEALITKKVGHFLQLAYQSLTTSGKIALSITSILIMYGGFRMIKYFFQYGASNIATKAKAGYEYAKDTGARTIKLVRDKWTKTQVEVDGVVCEAYVQSAYSGISNPAPATVGQLATPKADWHTIQSDSSPVDDIYDRIVRPSMACITGHWQDEMGNGLRLSYNCLAIFGQWFIMPRHQLDKLRARNPKMFSISTVAYHAVAYGTELTAVGLRRDSDVVAFRFLTSPVPSSRAVYKHFVSRNELALLRTASVSVVRSDPSKNYRAESEKHVARTFELIRDRADLCITPVEAHDGENSYVTTGSWSHSTSMPGCCGSPLLCRSPAHPRILGIHVAGSDNSGTGRAALITREDIEDFKNILAATERVCSPALPVYEVPANHQMIAQGDYAIVNDALPTNQCHHLPSKHHYRRMPTFEKIYPNDREPAPLSDYDERNKYRESIIKNCTAKYQDVNLPLPPVVIKSFFEGFSQVIEQLEYTADRTLTMHEAVNGRPGSNIQRLNLESSPGYPFSNWQEVRSRKGKAGLFTADTNGDHHPTARFAEAIETLEESWKEGERIETIYCDSQKVELLPLEKTRPYLFAVVAEALDTWKEHDIYAGPTYVETRRPLVGEQIAPTKTFKCRLIDAPPAHRTILSRKYNASFQDFLMEHRHDLGIMPGINPCSSEWGLIVTKLHEYNTLINDSDFTNFDGVHSRCALTMVRDIYFRFLLKDPEFAVDENQHVAFHACWDELITRSVVVKNLKYIVNHGLASGHDCTTPINCILLKLYLYLAWFLLARKFANHLANYQAFVDNVCAIVYGDDSLWAVKPHIDWYTAQAVHDELIQYGIKITPASKFTKTFPPPRPIEQLTFLSRSFTPHPTIAGVYYAQLKMESARALLNWAYVKGRPFTEAVRDNVDQYLRHIHPQGPEFYGNELARIRFHASSYLRSVTFPTWHDLERDFLQAWGRYHPLYDEPLPSSFSFDSL